MTGTQWCSWHQGPTAQPVLMAVDHGDHVAVNVYACPPCAAAHQTHVNAPSKSGVVTPTGET
ncbi:hypothetical protein FHS39_004912 [Streptomyces olivoverticillatus]|uniref:Uncharacterized protein n=1 Tax=Streptomyces olivoverticillatus TaxID=66427 RepID=A0A7W7PNR7_9ACTN|nr:hypothetical protein [Streptomyces olivoverticillatus]MBB4895833.1 hypothetical protein [Streptomyces olivoverticillatus]